ncbi:hypothetical protein FACS1894139_11840 [Planctomycetales bacterium]|nr:hypothetical protein FACS1894108_05020 [Planctomycetales bacterium]GHT06305.1 hypothetical protein FACS1894139_11840 [Planctomycetales bacterium]
MRSLKLKITNGQKWKILWLLVVFLGLNGVFSSRAASDNHEWLPGKEILLRLRDDGATAGRGAAKNCWFFDGVSGNVLFLQGDGDGLNAVRLPDAADAAGEFDYELAAITTEMVHGNLADAVAKLQNYLRQNPDSVEGWRYLGDWRYQQEDVNGAAQAYKTALRLNGENYAARRGLGIAELYLAYGFYAQNNLKVAHQYFQEALRDLHDCLETAGEDSVAAYGQALAAEGVSRELCRIAFRAVGGENEDTAKNIIRNCLDILDVAIAASQDRINGYPDDDDARLLLGGLFLRRARILQPFGHIDEAGDNLLAAIRAYAPVATADSQHAAIAKAQTAICDELLKRWHEPTAGEQQLTINN